MTLVRLIRALQDVVLISFIDPRHALLPSLVVK